MPNLHDTQPSRNYYLKSRDDGLRAPPKLLFWGVILFFVLVVIGIAGFVYGFREVLRPAQQQRIIDQLPFMSILRNPTPMGGVFPSIVSPENEDAALSLLDMPLNIASPTAVEDSATPVEMTATTAPMATMTLDSPATAVVPTATVSPTPRPTTLPSPEVDPAEAVPRILPSSARIYGVLHQQQTWNNCGPATITMALSYYGWTRDQAFAASRLKPNREDKNVGPQELADFVEEESNVKAIVRMGGTLYLLKLLVANEFPVVIEDERHVRSIRLDRALSRPGRLR